MAGLPPFNGFLSKEMFFSALLHIKQLDIFSIDSFGVLFPLVGWVASVLTFVYCMIIVWKTFVGSQPSKTYERASKEPARSEERRVGKEWRDGCARGPLKRNKRRKGEKRK